MKSVKRPVQKPTTAPPMRLFKVVDVVGEPPMVQPTTAVRFQLFDPRELFMGGRRVDKYLRDIGQDRPLKIRSFLLRLDYGKFEEKYKGGGRWPYAPVQRVGWYLRRPLLLGPDSSGPEGGGRKHAGGGRGWDGHSSGSLSVCEAQVRGGGTGCPGGPRSGVWFTRGRKT